MKRLRRNSLGITDVLTSAVFEWLMILLLFINGLFSYLVTRLAKFCKLQTPCLLCSRLDHVFGSEKPGFYLELLCEDHKLKVSSLVFCNAHGKLADVHGMCEGCLCSFATEKKSNSETYRLLVGTMGRESECCDHHDVLVNDVDRCVSSERLCSCCNEMWVPRLDDGKRVELKSTEPEGDDVDVQLPASLEKDSVHLHEGLQSLSEVSKEVAYTNVGTDKFDSLSHVGYSELKITSESGSEVQLSDNDDTSSPLHVQSRAKSVPLEPHSVHSNYFALEELNHPVSVSESSVQITESRDDFAKLNDITYLTPQSVATNALEDFILSQHNEKAGSSPENDLFSINGVPSLPQMGEVRVDEYSPSPDAVGQDLLELNLHQLEEKTGASLEPQLISLNHSPSPLVQEEILFEEFSKFPDVVGHGLQALSLPQIKEESDTSLEPELISFNDVPSSSNVGESFVEELDGTSNDPSADLLEKVSVMETQEICRLENRSATSAGVDMRANQVIGDPGSQVTNLMDLSDAYKLVITNKGNEATSIPEQLTVNTRVSGDLKHWLSQLSSSRGLELSLSEMSPRVHATWEDFKKSESPSPIGLQILQKRISLDRNMSGFESVDGSIVSEIEGESLVDRLKRQVEYDRTSMTTLYKELEEERNASSIAANQALAMITRLQEEKATLQMEALQYLRMMEEQAEYDVDALQKANALLAEKEKEVQDLEVELAICREKISNESVVDIAQKSVRDSEGTKKRMELLDVSRLRLGLSNNTPCNTPRENFEVSRKPGKTHMMNGNDNLQVDEDSSDGFEEERSYISECLKKLEEKLHLFSNNGVHFLNGGYARKEENGVDYVRQAHFEDVTQESGQNEASGLSMEKNSSLFPRLQENGSPSMEHYSSDYEEKDQETHLVVLEHEISELNDRLKTLEADRNFLEHTINSLKYGEGIEFIQEIAHDLRELRRIGIRREQELQ
ncbi:hypothetical protein ACHQM5_027294 [Ranunculus cassubicifolius]